MAKKTTKKRPPKSNEKATEIVMLLDRSGSMEVVKSDMIGGMNQFVSEQKKVKGKALFTLAQFDTEYETIYDGVDLKSVGHIDLVPRGCTALLDSIGRTINLVKDRIEKNGSKNRLLFVIITDGHENSSHEFTKKKILEMINEQKDKFNWEFTFLGANQDAIDEGMQIGVGVAQSLTYKQSKAGINNTFAALCSNTTSYRSGGAVCYCAKDRKAAVED